MYSQNKSLTKRLTEKVKKTQTNDLQRCLEIKIFYFILYIDHLRDILCERCLVEESM